MNRKHGQSQRPQNYQSQSSMRGGRSGQSNSQYGRNFGSSNDTDYDYDMNSGSRGHRMSADDSFESGRGYRDTDYDLDGSTYGSRSSSNLGGRSSSAYSSDSSYGGEMGDYDTNERIRPSRFSNDEERYFSPSRSSYDSSQGRYAGSQGERGLNRQGSSSERFGYPSSMNAWSGNDRQFNSGRTTGRTQSNFGHHESDMDLSRSESYGEGSLDRSNDWGSSQSVGQSLKSSWESLKGHFGKGPKGYKRSDDRIKEEVCETLARNPRIDASEIEVEVADSTVTLSGTVESKDIRRAAEMAIENLSGVDDVKNEIRIKKSDSSFSSSTSSSSTSKNMKNSGTSRGSGQLS